MLIVRTDFNTTKDYYCGTRNRESNLATNLQCGGAAAQHDSQITNAICSYTSFASVCGCSVRQSRFRGLPQDVAVPSRFRRRESVEKIQM